MQSLSLQAMGNCCEELALSDNPTLLWVSDLPVPLNVFRAAGRRWEVRTGIPSEQLDASLAATKLVVVRPEGACDDPLKLAELVDQLEESHAVAVFMLPDSATAAHDMLAARGGAFLCVSDDASSEELQAKFAAAEALQPAISRLRKELASCPISTGGVSEEVLSHELRLAARLQQDFLPRRLPEVGPARFGALFRPAFWVSGDIYDIMRLDETHVGFYVIDAVGHGLAAALLTMFIRRALQTKRITGSDYQIFQPDETLAELNIDICSEELSTGQFCTGVYCVLDIETMELTYARAGHPEPVLIRADGTIETLPADGPLLGVFPDGEFESRTVQLAPGDRVVLYTDGAEDALKQPSQDLGHGKTFARIAEGYRQTPRAEMLMQMTASLDIKYGLTDPEDDVTVVVMDIERSGWRAQ